MIDFTNLFEPLYGNTPSKDDVKLPKFKHSSNIAIPVLEVVIDRSYLTNIFLNACTDFLDWSCDSEVTGVPSKLLESRFSCCTGSFVSLHLIVELASRIRVRNAFPLICGAVLVILTILSALGSVSRSSLGLLLWRCTGACFTCSAASSSK